MRRTNPNPSLSEHFNSAVSQPRSPIVMLDPDEFYHESLAQPPSLAQLRSLTAIPSALAAPQRGGRVAKRKGKNRARLAREGQIISKLFDALGRRPQPTNGISLEQEIQLEMQVVVSQVITASATGGVPTFIGRTFSVNDFSGSSNLLSVFDQYRIDQLECWIETRAPNGTMDMPELYSAVDLDDANTPTSIGQVQDHQGSIVAMSPAGHYHKWRPHVAVATFSGAFTSYANVPAMFIDSASPNVQHFGLKLATLSSGNPYSYNMTVRAVITFRAPAIN